MAVPKTRSWGGRPAARGAVGLAVQPVRQTADDDRARLRHRQRQVSGRLPPVSTGAAGAHHTHAALPVQRRPGHRSDTAPAAGRAGRAARRGRRPHRGSAARSRSAGSGRAAPQNQRGRILQLGRRARGVRQVGGASVPARAAGRTARPGRGKAQAAPAHTGTPNRRRPPARAKGQCLSMVDAPFYPLGCIAAGRGLPALRPLLPP